MELRYVSECMHILCIMHKEMNDLCPLHIIE